MKEVLIKIKLCLDCNLSKSDKGLYCKRCGYGHRKRPSGLKYMMHKENPTNFKKGMIPWNKGIPSLLKKDNPGYDALHEWVQRWANDPGKCEGCGSTKNLEWSNKTEKYLRDLSDWQRLCKKCHCRYDFDNFKKREGFYV